MSQPFDTAAWAYDNGDVVSLRAPSLQSDDVEWPVLGARDSSSARLETISKLEGEEEYSKSKEAYSESEEEDSESEEEYSESEEEYSDSPLERETSDQDVATKAPSTACSPQDSENHTLHLHVDPSDDALDNFDFDSFLAGNNEFPGFGISFSDVLSQSKKFYNRITISDDRSVGSKIEERNLLALRGRGTIVPERKTLPPMPELPMPQIESTFELSNTPLNQKPSDVSAATGLDVWTPAAAGVLHSTEMSKEADENMINTDIKKVLDVANPSKEDLQKLQRYIELLQAQAREFESMQGRPAPSRYQIIYRIEGVSLVQKQNGKREWEKQYMPFFDHPSWVQGQGSASQLKSNLPLTNFELYLEKNKDISFLVYRDFDNKSAHMVDAPGTDRFKREENTGHPHNAAETVRLVNKDLIEVIKALLGSQQQYAELASEFSVSLELPAPYLFIYHSRKGLERFQDNLPVHTKAQLSLLLAYVMEQYADEYATADSLLARAKISPRLLRYLFMPGDVLVSCVDGQYQGYIATSWPKVSHSKKVSRIRAARSQTGTTLSLYGPRDADARMANDEITIHVCKVGVWYWAFDGNFQRQHTTLYLDIPAGENGENDTDTKGKRKIIAQDDKPNDDMGEKMISELNVFPMQYASAEIVDGCRRRGKTFWKCRTRNYVSYQATERDSIQTSADERYMIDLKTYSSLHPESGYNLTELKDELGPEALARDAPPDEQFELLLPLKIKGYNLRIKKWFDLVADRISDVKWNKEAFKNLVIDRKARDLIEALVSKQLAAEKGTDLIMGKGNGLILLLHGGPGTGKTLTAESVAEIAEKPLYRVTCGDVGTKAEDVEKYLESVLHLGKIWGCVVLLDEADVFLEQRSLEDMERNALVSVFLRVLEYYEGILVLTSNRVGTFDEAFKSRIQLALHYPVLGSFQRLRIWENFFNRLESFAEDDKVDIADLRDHLEDLKEEKMNGRQIRNAITTARQYAEWKGSILTYKYLSEVIEVSGRFDKYLDRLNGGFTQDQLAEDEGLRLA